jgi:D-alanyl-D-alanine carboxypeptidase (penicillin-binding protein 5/6)
MMPITLLHPMFYEPVKELQRLSTKAGVIMEEKTGKVIWQRDPDTPRYPASTTKIMTTLLMLENLKPDDVIVAPSDVKNVRESSMGLKPGERVRVKNMAYALMLRSANDGCYAVAVAMDGSVQKFAQRMNKRAAEIGCKNTHFANPNGLNDKKHVTSAFDLCLMGREAMQREDFREVVGAKRKLIDRSLNFADRTMINKNKILWKEAGADGIKTGWTIPAGHTYVGSAKRNETRFISSLMNAPKWQEDYMTMLNWAFNNYETKLVRRKGVINLTEIGGPKISSAELKSDVYACVKKSGDHVEERFEKLASPLKTAKGIVIGYDVVTDGDKFVQRIPVYGEMNSGVVGFLNGSSSGSGFSRFAVFGGLAAMIVAGRYLMSRNLVSKVGMPKKVAKNNVSSRTFSTTLPTLDESFSSADQSTTGNGSVAE